MLLGMIPHCPLERVHAAGNAAGTGARIALLNQLARDEIEDVIRRVEKIETAVEPKFQSHFVEAMAIPHATAGFPNLEQVVPLPVPKPDRKSVGEGNSGSVRLDIDVRRLNQTNPQTNIQILHNPN